MTSSRFIIFIVVIFGMLVDVHATAPPAQNGETVVPATQIIGNDNVGNPYLWEMVPTTNSVKTFKNPVNINALIPPGSGWTINRVTSINDNGAIVGTATYTPSPGDTTPAGSHGVLLIPLQCRLVNRDDPMQTWANNVLQNGIPPLVYGGIQAGDIVGWKIASPDSWSGATFTWTVKDSSGNPVTDFNGTTITGPNGAGINEWRIATWSAGGNDPNNQWLTWKPGTYTIKCVISWAGGGTNTPITFQQTMGTRANDVVVIGWIDQTHVPLSTSGVNSEVTSTLPVSGVFAGPVAKAAATLFLGNIATGSTVYPSGTAYMNSTDETYVLNWMFHFAANPTPPSSFADNPTLDAFEAATTSYKLINRLQVKWQQNGTQFQGAPIQIDHGATTYIGTTIDPIWGLPVSANAGPAERRIRITSNSAYNQMNDGTPDTPAVLAFNELMYPLIWSDIGSKLSEGPSFGSSYHLDVQVYPTYYVYVRNSDGSFTKVDTRPQAANPSGNFSSSPYPPNAAPWIIP